MTAPKPRRRFPARRAGPADPAPGATVRAIETRYAGHRFRSRLEARWVVFLEQVGIDWSYEAEGYTVGPFGRRRRYLPDIYLPAQAIWVEVKGSVAALDYQLMIDAAHPVHGLPAAMDADPVGYGLYKTRVLLLGPVPKDGGAHESLAVLGGEVVAAQRVVLACLPSGHRFVPVGELAEATADPQGKPLGDRGDPLHTVWPGVRVCDHVRDAYRAARAARFEHGESG